MGNSSTICISLSNQRRVRTRPPPRRGLILPSPDSCEGSSTKHDFLLLRTHIVTYHDSHCCGSQVQPAAQGCCFLSAAPFVACLVPLNMTKLSPHGGALHVRLCLDLPTPMSCLQCMLSSLTFSLGEVTKGHSNSMHSVESLLDSFEQHQM